MEVLTKYFFLKRCDFIGQMRLATKRPLCTVSSAKLNLTRAMRNWPSKGQLRIALYVALNLATQASLLL